MLGNLSKDAQAVRCTVDSEKLPYPLKNPASVKLLSRATGGQTEPAAAADLDVRQLFGPGLQLTLPADDTLLLHIR